MHIPLTRIQKLVGERMLQSKLSKPCFYIESKADVSALMALRPKLTKSLGVRITSNAFLIRALALAAKRFPVMIGRPVSSPGPPPTATVASPALPVGFSGYQDSLASGGQAGEPGHEQRVASIRIAAAVNVGFPIHAPQGLVVPVIKSADQQTLVEIARLEGLLTDKARSNKLTLEEMEGQTIGLSNLGPYGIDSFLGIVPPVASAILAVGNVIRTVVSEDGQASIRKLISLALTVDRRTSDETYAAEFLRYIIKQLQEPQQLV